MTIKQMLEAVGLETASSPRLPIKQAVEDNAFRLRDDERAIILAAVGPQEECALCSLSLFRGTQFHNAALEYDAQRYWICEPCRIVHDIEIGPGHSFPSSTKMIRIHKEAK